MAAQTPDDQWTLSAIDDSNRGLHFFLEKTDYCFFCLEYIRRASYQKSYANSFIKNFKKPVNRKGQTDYKYKEKAINTAIENFTRLLLNQSGILVPTPPSKTRQHPDYDDRMARTVQGVEKRIEEKQGNKRLKAIELVKQTIDMIPSSVSEKRPPISELLKGYRIQEDVSKETLDEISEQVIFIMDDMLTTGRHFKAMQQTIAPICRGPIIGIFLARRIVDDN